MTYRYPKSVPVLTADDICKGSLRDNGHSCILGWLGVTFLPIKRDELGSAWCDVNERKIWRMLPDLVKVSTVSQSPSRLRKKVCRVDDVVAVNDTASRKLSSIAAWFNRITASLGYVVGNPEAKNVK